MLSKMASRVVTWSVSLVGRQKIGEQSIIKRISDCKGKVKQGIWRENTRAGRNLQCHVKEWKPRRVISEPHGKLAAGLRKESQTPKIFTSYVSHSHSVPPAVLGNRTRQPRSLPFGSLLSPMLCLPETLQHTVLFHQLSTLLNNVLHLISPTLSSWQENLNRGIPFFVWPRFPCHE